METTMAEDSTATLVAICDQAAGAPLDQSYGCGGRRGRRIWGLQASLDEADRARQH
jgi:hypothetical protein